MAMTTSNSTSVNPRRLKRISNYLIYLGKNVNLGSPKNERTVVRSITVSQKIRKSLEEKCCETMRSVEFRAEISIHTVVEGRTTGGFAL